MHLVWPNPLIFISIISNESILTITITLDMIIYILFFPYRHIVLEYISNETFLYNHIILDFIVLPL